MTVRVFAHICDQRTLPRDVEISHFLQEYSPKFNIYAIVLSYGSLSLQWSGILLQEVIAPDAEGDPYVRDRTKTLARYHPPTKLLVRVGLWRGLEYKEAPNSLGSVDVDWRIL
jgi:hypothetical protein